MIVKIKKILFMVAFILPVYLQAQAPDFKVDTLHHSNRPDSEAIVMTFVGDGFTASEQDAFVGRARDYTDHLLGMYPFTYFKDDFNVYAIRVISNVSTAGGASNASPNSYFGLNTSFFGFAQGREVLLEQLLDRYTPEVDIIILYANSTRATGVARGFSSKYPSAAIQSAFNTNLTGPAWKGVTTHEMGHTFGGLRDEYRHGGGNNVVGGEAPNSTRDGNQATNRWRAFIGIDDIGIFPHQGLSGWFLPTDRSRTPHSSINNCVMDQSYHYWNFCRVCGAHLVRRMASITGEIFLGGSDQITTANVFNDRRRIVNYAFYGMYALQSANIAGSVESIGDYAFLRCTSLTTITNFATNPQAINNTTFHGVNRSRITLRVPAGSVAAYQAAWTGFAAIIPIPGDVNEPNRPARNQIAIHRARVNTWHSSGDDAYVRNALFDGNLSTYWHGNWGGGSGQQGGSGIVDIDLGSVQAVTEIELVARSGRSIEAVNMLRHGETGNIFPNGQSMTGTGEYPPINGGVSQSQINADFAATGWTAVSANALGLNNRTANLILAEPITTRYIRLNVTSGSHPQIAEIRVFSSDGGGGTSISNITKADNRYGIKFAVNPVSDKAEISVILPNNDPAGAGSNATTRAVETNVVIYDMVGNVVFEEKATNRTPVCRVIWDLRNPAGRFVANGTYLVIAEATDRNGRIYRYSARLGVNR